MTRNPILLLAPLAVLALGLLGCGSKEDAEANTPAPVSTKSAPTEPAPASTVAVPPVTAPNDPMAGGAPGTGMSSPGMNSGGMNPGGVAPTTPSTTEDASNQGMKSVQPGEAGTR